MTSPTAASGEKPLNRLARFGLVVSATLTIAVFYLFALTSIVVLLIALAIEFVVGVALARFGSVRALSPRVQRHGRLLWHFARSWWISQEREEFKVVIEAPDAPRLFTFLQDLCRGLDVSAPRQVCLMMNSSAMVELNGIRQGATDTVLWLGFDLIVGLNQRELEAVIAHEMTHAKLVRRGLWSWLRGGTNRTIKLTAGLQAVVDPYRRARGRFTLGEFFLNLADRLSRLMSRQVATYSRQDEFDADRGAAKCCGAAAMRSALLKLDPIHAKTARIGWSERVARLQSGDGFSVWLADELTVADTADAEAANRLVDRYSTHPSTHDRLVALPSDPTPLESSPRAVEFFAKPDDVAVKLVAEIERVEILSEKRDTRQRRRWLRQLRRRRPFYFPRTQVMGILLVAVGVTFGVFASRRGFYPPRFAAAAVFLAAGIVIYHLGRRREPLPLPIPDYDNLKFQLDRIDDFTAITKREKELAATHRNEVGVIQDVKEKRAYLLEKAYTALEKCDYLNAHVAARECVDLDGRSVEAKLAFAVGAAAFRQEATALALLGRVYRVTGLRTRSTAWGAAWAMLLLGDWVTAESLLLSLRKMCPDDSTFSALLAFCQSRRLKLYAALDNARHALAASPQSAGRIKLLVNLLLESGYLREAAKTLAAAGDAVRTNSDLIVATIRLNLLQRDFPGADQWIAKLKQRGGIPGSVCVQLGVACENARRDEMAASFYKTALLAGYYPAAHLGLGRLAFHRRDMAEARRSIMASLDVNRTLGDRAAGPLDLFSTALGHILRLEPPVTNARAMIASFKPGKSSASPLAGHSFLIYAVDQKQAAGFLKTITNGMHPDEAAVLPSSLTWKHAPRDLQPFGAVRPGIQDVWR